jgi:hypothetical protein
VAPGWPISHSGARPDGRLLLAGSRTSSRRPRPSLLALARDETRELDALLLEAHISEVSDLRTGARAGDSQDRRTHIPRAPRRASRNRRDERPGRRGREARHRPHRGCSLSSTRQSQPALFARTSSRLTWVASGRRGVAPLSARRHRRRREPGWHHRLCRSGRAKRRPQHPLRGSFGHRAAARPATCPATRDQDPGPDGGCCSFPTSEYYDPLRLPPGRPNPSRVRRL